MSDRPGFRVVVKNDCEVDALGYPMTIGVYKVGGCAGGSTAFRDYSPHNIAFVVDDGDRFVCSCCGRRLRREYLTSSRWRYCPRCGAEITGRLADE